MKTSTDLMLEEISGDLNQFLKHGNLISFTEKIDPNLNIDNIIKLLKIHFVLTTTGDNNKVGVIDFKKTHPQRLQINNTTVRKETEIFDGEVKGRINWQDTIKQRYNQNPENCVLFVCDKRERNYDIAENLVLKRLLQIVHDIVYNELKPAFENKYTWLEGWIGEKHLKNILNQLFLRNVYLKRVELTDNVVTDRMISRATKSRTALYKEAGELLIRYNKLMAYDLDPSEAKELLTNTFIKPGKAETLFELYWTIKIIKQFNATKFQIIEPGSETVATWTTKKHKYKIYHDSVGSFDFQESAKKMTKFLKGRDNYVGRKLKVFKKIEQLTGIKSDSLWSGRPDIILEKYDKYDSLLAILIGEVKYTQDKEYGIQGLRELLEYIALIKQKGLYLEKYADLFEKPGKLRGTLFVDFMGENKLDIPENDSVFVVMFGEDDSLSSKMEKWDQNVSWVADKRKSTFTKEKIQNLCRKARKASAVNGEGAIGWSKSTVDPMNLMSSFACLGLMRGFVLRAYQFRSGGNGNGIVWAMPNNSAFPEPEEYSLLEESFLEPPKPPEALDDIMDVVEGDGSPWSYLSASFFAREAAAFGAIWHGCDWSTHEILDEDPSLSDEVDAYKGRLEGGEERFEEWQWLESKPEELKPMVIEKGNSVTVSFYTYSELGRQAIYRHLDIYKKKGEYRFNSKKKVVAEGPGGYVF